MDPKSPVRTGEEAKARVEDRARFLTHLTCYVALNAIFVVLDFATSWRVFWSLYMAVVWGFLLYLHFMIAFVVADLRGSFRQWLLRREGGPESPGGEKRR